MRFLCIRLYFSLLFFVVVIPFSRYTFIHIYATAFSVYCCELFARIVYSRARRMVASESYTQYKRIHWIAFDGFLSFSCSHWLAVVPFRFVGIALCVPFRLLYVWIASPVLFWSKFSWVWNIVWARGFSVRCARIESGVLLWILKIYRENFVYTRF